MKRLIAVFALGLLAPLPAMAVGSFGVRLGVGTGMPNDDAGGDDLTVTPLAVGAAWKLSLAVIDLEVDALYWRRGMEVAGVDATEDRLALPVIARVGVPIVPLLQIGAGLEPRFLLGAEVDGKDASDNFESMVLFLPVVLGLSLDLGGFGIGADIRYEFQLNKDVKEGNDGARIHELMVFGGAFF